MTIDMAQFHQVFFEESFEGLDIMEQGLLNMDPGAADPEEINAIFRAAHSIKGGSGTFGFSTVSDFTHVMETLLDEMRDGRRAVTAEAVNILLASVDVLREMLTAEQQGGEADQARVNASRAELQRILSDTDQGDPSTTEGQHPDQTQGQHPDQTQGQHPDQTQGQHPDQTQGQQPGQPAAALSAQSEIAPIGWKIVFQPHAHLLRTGNDPLRIIRELSELGDLESLCDVSALPTLEDLEPEDSYLSWELRLNAPVDKALIDDIFEWVEDDCDFAVVPVMPEGYDPSAISLDMQTDTHPEAAAAMPGEVESAIKAESGKAESTKGAGTAITGGAGARATGKVASAATSSIRVDTAKIDSLINMVGELVITQSMLGLLGEDFSMDRLPRLREGLTQLERHTRELQESVMQIRMLPISFTFSRFPRLVHDLSQKLGKQIELELSGEGTEVDKTVIEKIGDPLVHLVRNSIDHGIELPEQRLAAGKPETGKVQLSAEHRGGNIVISISDDGKGLDRQRILDKAIARGLVREEDNLSDSQIYELIFQPGFSTAEQVSDVSGRGVGMDVVQRNINELGGAIEIESQAGEGSTITIRLPLTLAILDGQTVQVGQETYIVPLVSIIESIQVKQEMLSLIAGKGETFQLRDEYLPIVRLHEVFAIEQPRATEIPDGIVVVVEGGGRKCGILVDDLLGQQQVVIKSLEANYGKVEGISGATILGDGSVALIMDIPGLMRLATERVGPASAHLALSA